MSDGMRSPDSWGKSTGYAKSGVARGTSACGRCCVERLAQHRHGIVVRASFRTAGGGPALQVAITCTRPLCTLDVHAAKRTPITAHGYDNRAPIALTTCSASRARPCVRSAPVAAARPTWMPTPSSSMRPCNGMAQRAAHCSSCDRAQRAVAWTPASSPSTTSLHGPAPQPPRRCIGSITARRQSGASSRCGIDAYTASINGITSRSCASTATRRCISSESVTTSWWLWSATRRRLRALPPRR